LPSLPTDHRQCLLDFPTLGWIGSKTRKPGEGKKLGMFGFPSLHPTHSWMLKGQYGDQKIEDSGYCTFQYESTGLIV